MPVKSLKQSSLEGYSPWGCKRVKHELMAKKQQGRKTSIMQLKYNLTSAIASKTPKRYKNTEVLTRRSVRHSFKLRLQA